MTRAAALGFDVGTSAVKAGLLWLDVEEPMLMAARPYPTTRPHPGWAEQDPADWTSAMAACWAELRDRAGPLELRSVGLCSQVNTHLFVDDRLRPVRPAITWQDVRAADDGAGLERDASFSLSRLAWLERVEPAARSRTRWLLLPKDHCLAALTGEIATDALSAVGLVDDEGAYRDDVLGLVEGSAALLPPLRQHDEPLGLTLPDNPVGLPAGAPVAVGTMDAWGSFFGGGLLQPGRALDVAGTSEVVAVSSKGGMPVSGVVAFPPVGGVRVYAGPTQAGGVTLEWAAGLLSVSLPEALRLAAAGAADPQRVVFLPHLDGERAPYWNPDARGVFIGLTMQTRPEHLALAVLEGVAFSVRMLVGVCASAGEVEVPRVRVCGGGARSRLWNRLKAAALERPVDVLESIDAGVHGATLLGMVAAGLATDIADLAEERVHVVESIDPDPALAARLDELYGVYADSYRALEPIFPRLASASG